MIKFTRFTSYNNIQTKQFKRNGKTSPIQPLWSGYAETMQVQDLRHFNAVLANLRPSQCIGLGVNDTGEQRVEITTKKIMEQGAITRTKDNFMWPDGPSLMLFDFDDPVEGLTPAQYLEYLLTLYPPLKYEPKLVRPSVSSYIFDPSTGSYIKGRNKFHLYVTIHDGNEMRDMIKFINDRAKVNDLLFTNYRGQKKLLFDTAVASPERLVYEARPVLQKPLEDHKPDGRVFI
jgi:hypothetical protein